MEESFVSNAGSIASDSGLDHVPASETSDILEAEDLLKTACENSPFLQSMDAGDVRSLASSISIVGFSAGEQVMVKGQTATWVGIVLSGELAALVDGAVVGKIAAGKIVGELAFFMGGKRHADVEGHEAGFIAFIMTQNLLDLFKSAPSTGAKLLRAFGKSSLFQLSHNPNEHAPLTWNLSGRELAMATEGWQASHFDIDEFGIEPEDAGALVSAVRCHKFKAKELLVDRFADNGHCVCFVISGTVHAVLNGMHMRTFGEGAFLHDLQYFDSGLLPYNIVGGEDGILGSITSEAIESLAVRRPLLALALMRRFGNSAVRTVKEDKILERNDTSSVKRRDTTKAAAAAAAAAAGGSSASASRNASPVNRRAVQRRGSVAVFMPNQGNAKEGPEPEVEVFHKNKLQAQAERSNHNRILAKKFEREAGKAAEELAANEETKKGLERLLTKSREQVSNLKESEAHFTKLAFKKQKELERATQENDSLYRQLDELRQQMDPETANHHENAKRLQIELDDAHRKLKALEEQLAQSADAATERLQAETAQRQQMLNEAEDAFDAERQAMQDEMTAARQQLESREAEMAALVKARADQEDKQAERSNSVSRALGKLQKDKEQAERTIALQKLATKILATGYAMKMILLRRELKRAAWERDGVQHDLAELPARNEALHLQNAQLKEEIKVLKDAIEPLQNKMAHFRATGRRASVAAQQLTDQEQHLKMELAALQSQTKQLQEQATLLSASLITAQLNARRATAREQKMAKVTEAMERELSSARQERDTLRSSLTEVLHKVATFEVEFGPLLVRKQVLSNGVAQSADQSPRSLRQSPRDATSAVNDVLGIAPSGPVMIASRLTQAQRSPRRSPRVLPPLPV